MKNILAVAVTLAWAAPACAKVIFTGYGDFRVTPHGKLEIKGPQSVLNTFGITKNTFEQRGAAVDAVGLFATTELSETTNLQADFTYRNIGNNVGTTRIQYAFLENESYGARWRLGKLPLPFGYYNETYFYPFRRPSISGPVFNAGILGLPISDIGASARKEVELGPVRVAGDLYGVNGYGNVPGSTASFRAPSVPGGLSISNNIAAGNNSSKLSFGGRLAAGPAGDGRNEAGVSYYRGEWDPNGRNLFQMGAAHLHLSACGFDFLGETLWMKVKGDQGMQGAFLHPDWQTQGFFAGLAYSGLSVVDRALTPWVRGEHYDIAPEGGGMGRETLDAVAGGLAYQASEAVAVKAELLWLDYSLPFGTAGDLTLDGYTFTMGASVAF